jgi:Xaa-Pro dipeptidase
MHAAASGVGTETMYHGEAMAKARRVIRIGAAPGPRWASKDVLDSLDLIEGLPFPPSEYAQRRTNVLRALEKLGADAIVVFRPSSVEYLCGHHTIETVPQPVVVSPSLLQLTVPDPELGRALVSSCAEEVLHYSQFEDGLGLLAENLVRALGTGARVAIEPLDPKMPARFPELLQDLDLRTIDSHFLVERVRLVLSPEEISFIERAGEVTGRGIEATVEALRSPLATDSSAAAAARAAMARDANSEAPLGVIVATGRRAGIAHSNWNGTRISPGTTTFMEMSGAHHRYCAPLMRTVSHGPLTSRCSRLAELSCTTLETVLREARSGVPCSDVARSAQSELGKLEDWVAFQFTFGYPVGLAHSPTWMDGAPFFISADNPEPLETGMAFHVPASFRAIGEAGVGLSHTILVTEHGTRVLTPGVAEVVGL